MNRRPSGLWVADVSRGVDFRERRKTIRTVTLSDGQRAKVTVDDSGTVMQILRDQGLDAIVRPNPVPLRLRMRRT